MTPKPSPSRPKRGAAKSATTSILDMLRNSGVIKAKPNKEPESEVLENTEPEKDDLEFEDGDDDDDEDVVMRDADNNSDDDDEEVIVLQKKSTASKRKPTKVNDYKSTRKEGETRGRKIGGSSAKASSPKPKLVMTPGPKEHTEAFYEAVEKELLDQVPLSTKDPWLTGYRSVENKFIHSRGLNENCIKQLELITSLADVNLHHFNDSNDLSSLFFDFPEIPSDIKINNFEESPLSKGEYNKILPLNHGINFWVNDDSSSPVFNSHDIKKFPKNENYRKGSIINTGGLPLCTSWMPADLGEGNTQNYLFVSVIKHPNSTLIPQLSFANFESFESSLQIYKVLEGGSVELKKSVIFKCGAIVSMKWAPSHGNSGLLGCVFSDGSLKLFKFDENIINHSNDYSTIFKPSIELQIPNNNNDLKFVSFDWTSERTIAAGLSFGFLAEFDISIPDDPFYIVNLATTNIISVVSTFSDYILSGTAPSRKIILISTGDNNSYLIDLDILRSTQVIAYRTRFPSYNYSYTPFVGCFMVIDDNFSPRIFYPRDPLSGSIIPSAEDIMPCSMATSIYSNSSLVSFVDGKLKLMNLTKRELSTKISPSEPGSIVILQMERSDAQDSFRLNLGYHVIDSAKDGKLTVKLFNSGISATSINFNQRRGFSSWYSVSYGCGLVVVEKLQSASVDRGE